MLLLLLLVDDNKFIPAIPNSNPLLAEVVGFCPAELYHRRFVVVCGGDVVVGSYYC